MLTDLVLAVSSSTRIGVNNFLGLLNITRELVYGLNLDAGSQVAALTFSDQPYIQFQLNTFTTQLGVLNGLSMAYRSVAINTSTVYCCRNCVPRAGSGVVRIDPLRFLAGSRKRRLNQALPVLSLSPDFFECVCCAVRATFCVVILCYSCVLDVMGLPDGRKSLKIGLAVLIQYRRVTDRHPASQPRCRSI